MKNRIAAIALCVFILFALAACQNGTKGEQATAPQTSAESTAQIQSESETKAKATVSLGVTKAFEVNENNYKKIAGEANKDKCFGVYVSDAARGSDLLRAGFRRGDIIRSIDGTDIRSIEDIQNALLQYKFGDSAEIGVFRFDMVSKDALEYTVTVTFTDSEAPSATGTAAEGETV